MIRDQQVGAGVVCLLCQTSRRLVQDPVCPCGCTLLLLWRLTLQYSSYVFIRCCQVTWLLTCQLKQQALWQHITDAQTDMTQPIPPHPHPSSYDKPIRQHAIKPDLGSTQRTEAYEPGNSKPDNALAMQLVLLAPQRVEQPSSHQDESSAFLTEKLLVSLYQTVSLGHRTCWQCWQ